MRTSKIHIMKIVDVDLDTLKALASENRIKILLLVNDNKRNLAHLSKILDLPKSTVHRNLNILIQSELIYKINSHRKWCYYDITNKGKLILSSESKKRITLDDDFYNNNNPLHGHPHTTEFYKHNKNLLYSNLHRSHSLQNTR